MPSITLRPAPRRLPGKVGSVSRRGTISSIIVLFALHFTPALLPGTVLERRLEPQPLLVTAPERLLFFEPQPVSCAQDAGCLMETPHHTLPAALATPLRRHLPAVAARTLLPAGNRWLLAATGDLSRPGAVLSPPPRVGQPARGDSVPFDLVARADRLHVAVMFLIGTALMLAGTGLGLLVRAPGEPAAPQVEPWIPQHKVLPRLVASPVSPAHLESRP